MKLVTMSTGKWLLALFLLNTFDIMITTPAYEANPVTIYLWGKIGILLSAWLKIGLVLLLAGLYQIIRVVATPNEWAFSKKLLGGILAVLVAFYLFVVLWNTFLFVSINF